MIVKENMPNQCSEKRLDSGKRNFSLTFIQVICAISVVTLHTNGCFWTFSATERYWFTANIIECLCYFAVPIFFMITGITLLDYQDKYTTSEYFKKRIEKTLIPYISWSLLGVIFLLLTKRITIDSINFKWVINGLLSTKGIISLYWFFQPLFCVYLCIPLFASIDKKKKQSIAKYLLWNTLIINIILPFLNNVLHLGFEWPYRITVSSGYLFYIWGGYYIYNYPPSKRQKEMIYILTIIGLLMHIIGTYVLSMKAGSIQSLYKEYTNLPCVLYTFGVFILLNDVASFVEKVFWFRKIIQNVGEYTFPLYLIHWFVLRLIDDFLKINTKSIVYRLLAPYAIFIVVIGFTYCLRKIPGIRKIVP